jgi:uncharacterized membrane protein (UPF0136 family)
VFKALAIGLTLAFLIIGGLMGYQARAEVASIESRRAAVAEAVEGVKLSMQTRVLTLQREAGLAMDTEGATRFVKAVTPAKSDLNAEMDRLVDWRACAAEVRACKALRQTLAGSRQELWLMQRELHRRQEDLAKVDEELQRARGQMVW